MIDKYANLLPKKPKNNKPTRKPNYTTEELITELRLVKTWLTDDFNRIAKELKVTNKIKNEFLKYAYLHFDIAVDKATKNIEYGSIQPFKNEETEITE